jgi:hypothetical protein
MQRLLDEARPGLVHLREDALVAHQGILPKAIEDLDAGLAPETEDGSPASVPLEEPSTHRLEESPPHAFGESSADFFKEPPLSLFDQSLPRDLDEPPPRPFERSPSAELIDEFPAPKHLLKGRRPLTWLGLLIVPGAALLLATLWWARGGGSPASQPKSQSAAPSPAGAPPRPRADASHPDAGAQAPALVQPPVASAKSNAAVALLLEARRSVWIRATIDGRSDAGRVYETGEKKLLEGNREVSLRVGDGGAVLLSLNGKQAQPAGRGGEVVTRRFVPDERRPAVDPPSPPTTASTAGLSSTAGSVAASPKPPASSPDVSPAVPPPAVAPRSSPPLLTPAPASPSVAKQAGPPTPALQARPQTDAAKPEVSAALTTAALRWLDSYYKQDGANAQSAITRNATITDERKAGERLAGGLPNVRRNLERVTFQVVGESAILTARMTEQADIAGEQRQSATWISQIWIRDRSEWRLMDVRLLSDAKLK